MTTKEYELLNAINCEGLDNSRWGLWKFKMDTDSETQFETKAPFPLEKGVTYLAIWLSRDKDIYSFIDKVVERYNPEIFDVLFDDNFYLYRFN